VEFVLGTLRDVQAELAVEPERSPHIAYDDANEVKSKIHFFLLVGPPERT
jgi:hypothetical protein